MTRFLTVTGTDTGVGKTMVSLALVHALRARGHRVSAIKLVETGCSHEIRDDEDGVRLALAAEQTSPRHALLRLPEPLTPALAADHAGIGLSLPDLLTETRALTADSSWTLVEGAGGLTAPIEWNSDLRDVARALGSPLLIVAANKLGVLNHTILTLEAAVHAGVPIAGVVLNSVGASDPSVATNAASLSRILERWNLASRLLCVPTVQSPLDARSHLMPVVDWLEGT